MKHTQTPTPPLVPGFLTTSQAAERSGLTPPHIALLLRRNILRGIKIAPRLWLVETASLDAYLETEHKPGVKPKKK